MRFAHIEEQTPDEERKRFVRRMLTEIDSYESHELHGTNLYDTREHIGLEENRDKVLNELLERIEDYEFASEYKERWAQEMAEIERREEERFGEIARVGVGDRRRFLQRLEGRKIMV